MIKNVRIFYTYSGSVIAMLAAWATGKPWGHVGIAFEYHDGRIECFEARSAEGFVGPFPIEEARAYIKERGGKFLLGKPLVEISEQASAAIYENALDMVGNVSYSKIQLGLMWLSERYGFKPKRSEDKIVCSEAVAMVVHPHLDLRDANHDSFDTVPPNSAYWRMCEIQAGYNAGAKQGEQGQ